MSLLQVKMYFLLIWNEISLCFVINHHDTRENKLCIQVGWTQFSLEIRFNLQQVHLSQKQ